MNWLVWLVMTGLISCAAYKVGKDRTNLSRDLQVQDLLMRLDAMGQQQVRLHWQLNTFHQDYNMMMVGTQYGFPPDGWNDERGAQFMRDFREAEARHRAFMGVHTEGLKWGEIVDGNG